MRFLGIACLGLALLVPAAAAVADDEDCLVCHEDLEGDDGQRIGADLASLPDSIHGELGLGCVDCHVDVADLDGDHPEELQPAACGDCHIDVLETLSDSAHRGQPCGDCHGGHTIVGVSEDASPTSHFRAHELCASCHEVLGEQASDYLDSIHGRAVTKAGLNVAPTCITCHGAHDIFSEDDSRAHIHRSGVAEMCGECHEGLLPDYSASVHASLDAETGEPRAVCSDCHLTHAVGSPDLPAWRQAVVTECGECHGEMLASFTDGFHGQATLLGFERVAKCGDCHGFHGIRAVDDPQSRVAEGRIVETCQTCHPQASANWAQYDPHAELSSPERNPQAYWAKVSMTALLAAVFSFFFLHTVLWLPRAYMATRAARRAGEDSPSGERRS